MGVEITNKMLFDVLMRIDGELAVLRREMADLRTNTEVSLAALRKDMEEGLLTLRKDMEAGFARVDGDIANLRTDMEMGFARLDSEMGALRGDMASLSQALVTHDGRLVRLEKWAFPKN